MSTKEYLKLVSRAFEILGIKLSPEKRDLNAMLDVLKKVAGGPVMSKSDICVHDQIRELVKAIELNKPLAEIEKILENLANEVNYNYYWD